jgi:Ca2+-dependent lipid-binding protein
LKNKELIGKSDPYVVLYVRPMFKVKTQVIDDNLNPEWNETFELIVEDKETQSVIFEVILCFVLSLLLKNSLASKKSIIL